MIRFDSISHVFFFYGRTTLLFFLPLRLMLFINLLTIFFIKHNCILRFEMIKLWSLPIWFLFFFWLILLFRSKLVFTLSHQIGLLVWKIIILYHSKMNEKKLYYLNKIDFKLVDFVEFLFIFATHKHILRKNK